MIKDYDGNISKTLYEYFENNDTEVTTKSINLLKVEKQVQEKPTLLHIGRIAKGKGQSDAIMACEVLYANNIDFTFYLVGGLDKEYEKDFMLLYNSLAYKKNIILVGFTNDVESYLAKSDIFLFPSYGEGLSNAFLEALSVGLYPIAYNNTSFPELKELGLSFELVEDKNIEKLKKTLENSIKNLIFKKQQSQENIKLVKKLFNEKTEICKFLEILI